MVKFCKNCGTELKEGAICQNCGTVNEKAKKSTTNIDTKKEESKKENTTNNTNSKTTNNNYTKAATTQYQTNSMAVAGFVLSLVSLFCCGFCNILGLIFSIIGYTQASKYNNNNKGLALAGIIISGISLALIILTAIFSTFYSFSFFNYYK